MLIESRYYPTAGRAMSKSNAPESGWRHTPEHLRTNLMDSLKALKADKIDMVCISSQKSSTPSGGYQSWHVLYNCFANARPLPSGTCMGRTEQRRTL